ncbi:telomere length regulation protein-domain-containing protein [Dichotomocladium elegans]|nr:telomere length regulation protein-domain-containing protein [Dichotomocladium elegans]
MSAQALRSLDDKTLAKAQPTLDTITRCLEEALALVLDDPMLAETQAWRHHIWIVAQTVIPMWSFGLKQQVDILDRTCLGTETLSAATRVAMAQTSLLVMTDSLVLCGDAPLDALRLYERILRKLCQEPMFSLYVRTTTLRDPRFFCASLCAIPGKMANSFGIHQQKAWYYDSYFYRSLARQLGQAIGSEPASLTFCKELFSKMARQGFLNDAVATLYPMALIQLREKPSRGTSWRALWSAVPQDKLNEALFDHIQQQQQQEEEDKEDSHYSAAEIVRAAADLDIALGLHGSPKDRIEAMLDQAFIKMAKKRRQGTQWTLASEAADIVENLARRIIEVWADPVFIAHGGYHEQTCKDLADITGGLLLSLGYLDEDRIKDIVYSTGLMGFIHAWFDSKDLSTAKLGVLVAESISHRVDQEGSRFKSGILDGPEDVKYKELQALVDHRDALTPGNESGGVAYLVETPESDVSDQEEQDEECLDPDAVVTVDDEDTVSEDSDLEPYPMEDESSDDDDDEAYGQQKKSKLKRPTYILDLISYLKDYDDPLKIEMGLKSAAELIQESSLALAARLLHLPDTYELPGFREQQQAALTALVVAVPQRVTEYLVDELYGRNTSIEAKQVVLGTIILGVRELAGWSEDTSIEPARQRLERLLLEPASSPLQLQEQQTQAVGKARVFSRRMEVEKKRQTVTNRLSGVAGSCFFFPLLVGWWEGSQGRTRTWLGHNTMLAERFVMTLNVIMHCATNTPDKRRIVTEYLEFALSLRYAHVTKNVTSALLTGFEIILNISYQGQEKLLLRDYGAQLAETKNWLEEILELVNEDQLKEKAIRLLARLMQISAM